MTHYPSNNRDFSIFSEHKRNIVSSFSALLKRKGDQVLQGESRLVLNTFVLFIFNEHFQVISDEDFLSSFEVPPPSSDRDPFYHDVRFLFDFIQRAPFVKVVHGSCSLPSRVNVSCLRGARSLEICKVPVHLIVGLQRLRSRLTSVVCVKSLQSLQEVFEFCGGDQGPPVSWPELKRISINYNNLMFLDNSLRLLPNLEQFDISHNTLQSTENFLEYLTDLKTINLSFNCLTSVPTFAFSSRSNLKILNIRYNALTSLKGLEVLAGLNELDVSYNCIASHTEIDALQSLTKLKQLNFKRNPLCYHKNWFALIGSHIYQPAIKDIVLNGQRFTAKLIQLSQKLSYLNRNDVHNKVENPQISPDSFLESQEIVHKTPSSDRLSVNSNTNLSVSTSKKKKSRQSRRPRNPTIHDEQGLGETDGSEGLSTEERQNNPSLPESFKSNHMILKDEMETIRRQLGADWLQSLSHTKTSSSLTPFVTDDDILLRDNEAPVDSTSHDLPASPPLNQYSSSNDVVSEESCDTAVKLSLSNHQNNNKDDDDGNCGNNNDLMTDSAISLKWSEKSNNDQAIETDYGPESDPFIVFHISDPSTQVLVSVSDKMILEKDLNGVVTEALDLKSLTSLQRLPNEFAEHSNVVSMQFDRARKDLRERSYIMEDAESVEEFVSLLDVFLKTNSAFNKSDKKLQCLKCAKYFLKSEAKMHLRRESSVSVIYGTSVETDDLKEVYSCPVCNSSMLIEMEVNHEETTLGSSVKDNTPHSTPSITPSTTPFSTPFTTPASNFRGTTSQSDSIQINDQSKINANPPDSSSTPFHKTVQFSISGESYKSSEILAGSLGFRSSDLPYHQEANSGVVVSTSGDSVDAHSSDIDILSKTSRKSLSSIGAESDITICSVQTRDEHSEISASCDRRSSDVMLSSDSPFSGSLTDKTIASLVDSVYSNTADDSVDYTNQTEADTASPNGSLNPEFPATSTPEAFVAGSGTSALGLDVYNFLQIDHRLKLYLSMKVFDKADEEFRLAIKSACRQYSKSAEEFTALLVVTSVRVYVLKLVDTKLINMQQPQKWLKVVKHFSLAEVQFVSIGLNYQYFKLGCAPNSSSCFAFITRDADICKQFIAQLTAHVQSTSLKDSRKLESIDKESLFTTDAIVSLLQSNSAENIDCTVLHFSMCYKVNDTTEKSDPISLIITETHVISTVEDVWFTLPNTSSNQEPPSENGKFKIVGLKPLSDVAYVELSNDLEHASAAMSLVFIDEESNSETRWPLICETVNARSSLVSAIRQPWKQQFGVELEVVDL